MDSKVTLSFDQEVIERAKKYAASQNMSLSRLTEYLLRQVTTENYYSLEHFPVAEWVSKLAEGEATYVTKKRGRKSLKDEYHNRKK